MNAYVTPVYAALLALLFITLSVRTLRLRRRLRIALGDSGDERMLRATRVHANFAEYVPLTLLLISMFEIGGAPTALVHVLGACLLLGRVLHAFGVATEPEDYRFRVLGMVLTFTALAGGAGGVLYAYARAALG